MTESEYNRLLDALPVRHTLIGQENSAAVMATFVNLDDKMHLLLEKRAKGIPQGGEICFPGGRPDEGDKDLQATAVRETGEELGIPEERIHPEGLLGTLFAGPGMVDVYVGRIEARDRNDFSINPDEVEKLLFIPFVWFLEHEPEVYKIETEYKAVEGENGNIFAARELGLPQRYWGSWKGRPHSIYLYKFDDEIIWGMTARMIQELVRLCLK
ncbi:MAG: CoA pyrophosphatase [Spirochaetales bacterium]|nr:CoA pyrophosphatase [Spirochaetales bacterium]